MRVDLSSRLHHSLQITGLLICGSKSTNLWHFCPSRHMNGFAEEARLAAVAWVIGNYTCLALIWDAAIVVWKLLNARHKANTTGLLLLAQEETQMKQTFKAFCVAVSPPSTAPQLRWARPGSGRDQAFSATSSSYRSGLAGFLTATNITLESENATQLPLQQPVVLFLRKRNEEHLQQA